MGFLARWCGVRTFGLPNFAALALAWTRRVAISFGDRACFASKGPDIS
jgi:hypothetical protein